MKFKVDENLPLEIVELLRSAGHDAHSVPDENLTGASDEDLRIVCERESRHLITRDLDFADIRTLIGSCGFVIIRSSAADKHTCIRIVEAHLQHFAGLQLSGKIVILEIDSVRVRER
jgi:predicted nuclease of predicted toxin-antitoxin system